MSNPPSPAPSSGSYVPYQAYKSKRHSRNLSGHGLHLIPNQSPPPISRPASGTGAPITLLQPLKLLLDGDLNTGTLDADQTLDNETILTNSDREAPIGQSSLSVVVHPPMDFVISGTPPTDSASEHGQESISQTKFNLGALVEGSNSTPSQANGIRTPVATSSSEPQRTASSPLAGPSGSHPTSKKASKFRRLPVQNTRQVWQATNHSRNVSTSSVVTRPPEKLPAESQSTTSTSTISSPPVTPGSSERPPLPALQIQESISHQETSSSILTSPSSTPIVLSISHSAATSTDANSVSASRLPRHVASSTRKPAPYPSGFQPKGVYRPLTDEFFILRRAIRDGEGEGGMTRVERTKLERRLEKLIGLHFPRPSMSQESLEKNMRPSIGRENRKSSFFDFQNLRNINIHDAGDLWRGVVSGDTSKTDIRASEQRITPWQDDAAVNKCPLCSASFHPLTSRKHHCRLCGQIICSLPIKHPQRKTLCSSLFVVDTTTRKIEEVGEGVDYGVKKRKMASSAEQHGRQEEEDKFLKGVRICRECRPILQRQQYYQQTSIVPPFAKLYENFINLETDIEDSLPKFQELLMSLNHRDQPTKEASAARKRLLESFAQYDKLSKKIRTLPCSNGPGSSQDRVQAAIMTRANLFLQKNMFPLQSLPTPQPSASTSKSPNSNNAPDVSKISVDMDSALAHTLQPLLEQESLLESFVEEAQAQRKFEDVKTLKVNLAEIRQEIERVLEGNKV